MAVGSEGLASAGLGLLRLRIWDALSVLFNDRRAVWYSVTARRLTHPDDFKTDMTTLFELLRDRAIHPVVVDRLPLDAARVSTLAGWVARSCCCPGHRKAIAASERLHSRWPEISPVMTPQSKSDGESRLT